MPKKINRILNIVMGSIFGAFIGRAAYVYWEYKTYPNLYAMQSAPWYTSIVVTGLFTVSVLIIALVIKVLVNKRFKSKQ